MVDSDEFGMAGAITCSVCSIHATSYNFVGVYEDAADGDFVSLQGELALCFISEGVEGCV